MNLKQLISTHAFKSKRPYESLKRACTRLLELAPRGEASQNAGPRNLVICFAIHAVFFYKGCRKNVTVVESLKLYWFLTSLIPSSIP